MDGNLVVVLDHFELGMLQAEALPAQARLAENHEPLTGCDHFLDVMQIEPPEDERLAQCVRVRFLQGRFENLLPATEAPKLGLHHFATQADRHVAFFARKAGKLRAVLVPARKMGDQIFDAFNAEPPQRRQLRPRNPIQLAQRLRGLNHAIGAASRNAST